MIPVHPARYTAGLMAVAAELLAGEAVQSILDPFAGVGGIFALAHWLPQAEIFAVEIEADWAAADARIACGDALALPFADDCFDAVVTSPTYGNRMADHHNAADASRRHTYRHSLNHPLHAHNAGALQWGPAYRAFHARAWAEARRVLRPGGLLILNIKDHIRAGARMPVTRWHVSTLESLGCEVRAWTDVPAPGQRHGAHGDRRIVCESLIKFQLHAPRPGHPCARRAG